MVDRATPASCIEIRSLYKVFGANAAVAIEMIKQGMSKAELNERYGVVLGLNNINIDMAGGTVQVIMGLSGSGKSTLIRHINRLIDPTAGEVRVGGRDVVKMNRKELREFRRINTAMVFQKFALLPHRTVLDNAVYGLELRGLPRAQQVDKAMHWISRVGLAGFESKYPNQLSGGMQQRVGLARALTNDASILLMDEALSALDPLIRMDMQDALLDLQKELKKTIVFITHDLQEALRLGDRIAILRDGEIIQQGTPQDIVLRPADDYVAKFTKEVNKGRVVHVEAIMRPLGSESDESAMAILNDTNLEEAARSMLSARRSTACVVNQSGRPLGTVDFQSVAEAIVSPMSDTHKISGSDDLLTEVGATCR